uniref:Uncharacterized protein n=1 Tax=Chenopodium quinoa TaxID=63459 RepID=A0A803MAX2_CHEQI
MLHRVHTRTREERPVIVLNSLDQPVGPTKEIVQEFKFFLGTVARDSELAPVNYRNFPSLPTLDKILDYVQEKIDALEPAQSQEDGNVCNDPYSEVIPSPKRKSCLHLYGSGVKKSDLKNKDIKSNYILLEEFLVGIRTQLVQEIAPTITAAVLDLLPEVNPGINLVVPSTLQQLTPHDASSAPNRNTAQSGQSSKSFNQVLDDDELPRDE